MDNQEKSSVEDRLQSGVYGTRKLKPDEQRRYLGTFRERVYLTISVQQIKDHDWTAAVAKEIKRQGKPHFFINGNLDDDLVHPYILLASKNNCPFTVKTGDQFKTDPDRNAIVLANDKSVYQDPIDVAKRYPIEEEESTSKQETKRPSLFKRLFHK